MACHHQIAPSSPRGTGPGRDDCLLQYTAHLQQTTHPPLPLPLKKVYAFVKLYTVRRDPEQRIVHEEIDGGPPNECGMGGSHDDVKVEPTLGDDWKVEPTLSDDGKVEPTLGDDGKVEPTLGDDGKVEPTPTNLDPDWSRGNGGGGSLRKRKLLTVGQRDAVRMRGAAAQSTPKHSSSPSALRVESSGTSGFGGGVVGVMPPTTTPAVVENQEGGDEELAAPDYQSPSPVSSVHAPAPDEAPEPPPSKEVAAPESSPPPAHADEDDHATTPDHITTIVAIPPPSSIKQPDELKLKELVRAHRIEEMKLKLKQGLDLVDCLLMGWEDDEDGEEEFNEDIEEVMFCPEEVAAAAAAAASPSEETEDAEEENYLNVPLTPYELLKLTNGRPGWTKTDKEPLQAKSRELKWEYLEQTFERDGKRIELCLSKAEVAYTLVPVAYRLEGGADSNKDAPPTTKKTLSEGGYAKKLMPVSPEDMESIRELAADIDPENADPDTD